VLEFGNEEDGKGCILECGDGYLAGLCEGSKEKVG